MFGFLLVFTILLACGLSYLYSPNVRILAKHRKKYIIFGWICIYFITMLMSNYLAVVGIPFSSQSSSLDFMDVISVSYIANYIQMSVIIAIVIGIYWFLRKFIPAYWFIILMGIFSIITYYPGIPYSDTNDLYRYYLHNNYSDWQPALYSIWWNIFGFYGVAFLVNNISYYLGLGYISYHLDRQKKNWQNNLLVLFSLNPIFFTQLNYVFKDTLFAGLLIDAIAVYLILQRVKTFWGRFALYGVYFIILFLVVGTRYNGLTSILPFVVLIFWSLLTHLKWSKIKKLSFTLCATVIITFLFVQGNIWVVYNIFKATKSHSVALVMQNDLANIECRTNHVYQIPDRLFANQDNVDLLRQEMCNPLILNEYNYDTLFDANWNGQGNPQMLLGNSDDKRGSGYNIAKQIWLPTVLHHPFVYAYYRLRFILNDTFAQYYMPTYSMAQINQWPEGVDKPNLYNPVKLSVQLLLAQISQAQHADMRYVLGLFIIIGMLSTLFYLIITADYSLAFIVLLSNLFTFMGLYLVLGEHAARFFLWNDIATILAIVLINPQRKNKN